MSNSQTLDLGAVRNGQVKTLINTDLAGADLSGTQLATADLSKIYPRLI